MPDMRLDGPQAGTMGLMKFTSRQERSLQFRLVAHELLSPTLL